MKRYLFFIPIIVVVFISSCNTPGKVKETKQEEEPLPPLTEKEKVILEKIGGKVLPDKNLKIGNIIIHRREKEISFPAKMCITDGGEYGIEVLISLPHGRTHEALLITEIDPVYLQLALYLIGAENGSRISLPTIVKQGSLITIDVKPEDGERVPVEEWLYNIETEEFPPRSEWVFVGSSFHKGESLAKAEGNVVNVIVRGDTILDNVYDYEKGLGVNESLVPERDSPVTVYFSIATEEDKKMDYTR